MPFRRLTRPVLALGALWVLLLSGRGWSATVSSQGVSSLDAATVAYDRLLDQNVRDGLVYYRALKQQRGALDRFVAALALPATAMDGWSRERRAAFWINAYNALVVRLVLDHYPIAGRSAAYPPGSVRQIPGAFDRVMWRVGGRSLTLDQLESTLIAQFDDPRMLLALGRGAVGSGRLRSEAYDPSRLEEQLASVVTDCVQAVTCVRVDEPAKTLWVSPVLSWREAAFVRRYAEGARGRYPGRSPIELAAVGLSEPALFASERAWLQENTFQVRYMDFDWRLNDLTGGPPR
ncbi:MAG: DUF547 domain-containing protein [Vicinamibacterales bacterium]